MARKRGFTTTILLIVVCYLLCLRIGSSAIKLTQAQYSSYQPSDDRFRNDFRKVATDGKSNGTCGSGRENIDRQFIDVNGTGLSVDISNNVTEDCYTICHRNCSCGGYAYLDSLTNYNCLFFIGELKNDTKLPQGDQMVYFLTFNNGTNDSFTSQDEPIKLAFKRWWWIWILVVILPATAMALTGRFCYIRTKYLIKSTNGISEFKEKDQKPKQHLLTIIRNKMNVHVKLDSKLQFYRYETMLTATDQFSGANKLGEGGFGAVYKGVLIDGQEIAVKRLSRRSGQGLVEFKNEITLIANLQHKNLVRLLGCCIHGNEKLLVYEYLPNKSLDYFLFNPSNTVLLDWKTRFRIIEGIAQGLLYLHNYSRIKVIHRDLKPGNVLLDDQMDPKISDFGLARICEQNVSMANTKKVVGTYGYMSPEYTQQGIFSEKSDVFSFGVMVLEIISGMKNTGLCCSDRPQNLIGYIWDLWRRDKLLKLIDESNGGECNIDLVLRHIHVALLCVQESVGDRPKMFEVVRMLKNGDNLLTPERPAFYFGKR